MREGTDGWGRWGGNDVGGVKEGLAHFPFTPQGGSNRGEKAGGEQ